MTLLCRPKGRGNWRIQPVHIPGWPDPLLVWAGMTVTIGSHVLRIVKVQP